MENLPAIKSLLPAENEFQMLQVVSRNAASSGLYGGVGGEQKIFMILLAARELGIMPMQALNGGIWNIQGKIEISARLMSAMIRRAGHSIISKVCNETECTLEGKRADNGDTFRASFTMEDARKAGLAGRGPWKSYAEDMLYARAMSRLGRRLFPDVIGTAYVEGEIRDAKCEIISDIPNDKEKQETDEQIEILVRLFVQDFPEEEHSWIASYLTKYANYWKKRMSIAIQDYSDKDRFWSDFNKWKSKEFLKLSNQREEGNVIGTEASVD